MKFSVRETSHSLHDAVIAPEKCAEIREKIRALPPHVWFRRTGEMPGRGYPGETCAYWYATHRSMPPEFSKELGELAPKVDGWKLDIICINKYLPGDYIGTHRDRGTHPFNLVIPLQDGEDGMFIKGELLKDKAGRAGLNAYTGLPHSVPPVKSERYVLIFLFNEEFHDGKRI